MQFLSAFIEISSFIAIRLIVPNPHLTFGPQGWPYFAISFMA